MNPESMTIYATYECIRLPSLHLRRLLSSNQVPEEIINGCELALHELLTNLVDHAYEGDGSQSITVNLSCANSKIQIETYDTGKRARIDLDQAVMPDPSELLEGGYGVAIITSLMDEVKYKSEQGRNIWQLIKKI